MIYFKDAIVFSFKCKSHNIEIRLQFLYSTPDLLVIARNEVAGR